MKEPARAYCSRAALLLTSQRFTEGSLTYFGQKLGYVLNFAQNKNEVL